MKYSLEQFRAIDNNISIKALITNAEQLAVDVPGDLEHVLSKMGKSFEATTVE